MQKQLNAWTNSLLNLGKKVRDKKATLPHLLFAGPPGTGKTSAAKALILEMYGEDFRILELNASDDRGIKTVREQVKSYCQTQAWDGALNIVFLDEADGLTADAQGALRRIMEKYARNTRFILSCNFSNRIIDPVRGRCAVMNFYALKSHDIKMFLLKVAKEEGVQISKSAAMLIAQLSKGDLRSALNAMHFLAQSQDEPIKDADVYEYGWRVDIEEIRKLLFLCLKTKELKTNDDVNERLDEIDKALQKLYEHGLTDRNMVDATYLAITTIHTSAKTKAKLFKDIGELDYRITIGANPYVQIRAFFYGLLYGKIRRKKK